MEDYEYEFDYDELFTINPFAAREDVNQADTIETVQILYETCVFPSVASIVPIICYLLMFNMLFNMTTQAGTSTPCLYNATVNSFAFRNYTEKLLARNLFFFGNTAFT